MQIPWSSFKKHREAVDLHCSGGHRSCEQIGIRALFPSLHHRKEGWLRHQENAAKPPKLTQPGWFSYVFSIGKPPRPRDQQMLRGILLIARPPLLAVMQGEEYARFHFVHTFAGPPLESFRNTTA